MAETSARNSEDNSTGNQNKKDKFGFNYYEERRTRRPEFTLWDKFLFRDDNMRHDRNTCEKNVIKALKDNHTVRILYESLKKAGCPVTLKRHIVCEPCSTKVSGGYDCEYNQIVICQNSFKSRTFPEAVLVHELVHMYDYCVGNIDFKNLDHLACTEIRAANIAHCSFISSLLLGQSSPINIKRTHQYCVKIKAAQTLQLSRDIDFPTAMKHILKVFDKCYNDLEPVGRRMRRNSIDPLLAFREAEHYNFCNSGKEEE